MCDTKNIYFTITANDLDNVVVAWRVLLPYIEDLVPCSIPQSFYMEVLECVSVCGGSVGGGVWTVFTISYRPCLWRRICLVSSPCTSPRLYLQTPRGARKLCHPQSPRAKWIHHECCASEERERGRPWKTNSGNDNNKPPPELRHNSQ